MDNNAIGPQHRVAGDWIRVMRMLMSKIRAFVLALLMFPPLAVADTATHQGLELARARQCLGCHQVEARRVGPPFAAIAERFGDQPGAAEHLADVIRRGSVGQWGAIPMPAQPRVSPIDAQRLALWILSLSKDE